MGGPAEVLGLALLPVAAQEPAKIVPRVAMASYCEQRKVWLACRETPAISANWT